MLLRSLCLCPLWETGDETRASGESGCHRRVLSEVSRGLVLNPSSGPGPCALLHACSGRCAVTARTRSGERTPRQVSRGRTRSGRPAQGLGSVVQSESGPRGGPTCARCTRTGKLPEDGRGRSMRFPGFAEGRLVLHVENKFCFSVGVAGSGFPFDFGRIPYKGKRPLRDMIGSSRNRHVSGEPSADGAQSAAGVRSQQEELERLRKDLSSQKVAVLPPHVCPLPPAVPRGCSPGPRGSPSPDGPSPRKLDVGVRDTWVSGGVGGGVSPAAGPSHPSAAAAPVTGERSNPTWCPCPSETENARCWAARSCWSSSRMRVCWGPGGGWRARPHLPVS